MWIFEVVKTSHKYDQDESWPLVGGIWFYHLVYSIPLILEHGSRIFGMILVTFMQGLWGPWPGRSYFSTARPGDLWPALALAESIQLALSKLVSSSVENKLCMPDRRMWVFAVFFNGPWNALFYVSWDFSNKAFTEYRMNCSWSWSYDCFNLSPTTKTRDIYFFLPTYIDPGEGGRRRKWGRNGSLNRGGSATGNRDQGSWSLIPSAKDVPCKSN
jgi:hypothetical protein